MDSYSAYNEDNKSALTIATLLKLGGSCIGSGLSIADVLLAFSFSESGFLIVLIPSDLSIVSLTLTFSLLVIYMHWREKKGVTQKQYQEVLWFTDYMYLKFQQFSAAFTHNK